MSAARLTLVTGMRHSILLQLPHRLIHYEMYTLPVPPQVSANFAKHQLGARRLCLRAHCVYINAAGRTQSIPAF